MQVGDANARRVFAMEIRPGYVDVAVEDWQGRPAATPSWTVMGVALMR